MVLVPDIAITFPPGARGSFLHAFLKNKIDSPEFEFIEDIPAEYKHTINPKAISKFEHRIFVSLDLQMLDVWLYLFWQKNILVDYEGYEDVFKQETFDKLYISAKNLYNYCIENDLSCFNYVVPFSKIFDWKYLSNLYYTINHKLPTNKKIIVDTNKLSTKTNTACKVIKEIIRLEKLLEVDNDIFTMDMFELYKECLQNKDVKVLEKNIVKSNYIKRKYNI